MIYYFEKNIKKKKNENHCLMSCESLNVAFTQVTKLYESFAVSFFNFVLLEIRSFHYVELHQIITTAT